MRQDQGIIFYSATIVTFRRLENLEIVKKLELLNCKQSLNVVIFQRKKFIDKFGNFQGKMKTRFNLLFKQ